jgi:hypothetical protein
MADAVVVSPRASGLVPAITTAIGVLATGIYIVPETRVTTSVTTVITLIAAKISNQSGG